jgi:hypothetical protein
MGITNNYNNRNRNTKNNNNNNNMNSSNGSNSNSNSNVSFIDSSSDNALLHPQLYCRICDVLMMFMLNGKFANKYFCGMCGVTEDPEESEFYSKHVDQLRSVDDDDGSNNGGGAVSKYRYEDMIVQSKGNNQQQSSMQQKSERQPQMTNQRQKQSSPQHGLTQDGSIINNNNDDDWASSELKRDLEANGSYNVVKIMDIDNTVTITTGNEKKYQYHSKSNRIERPG